VDTIIADVFSLLSLFFLTIGKSRESPATYCQIASMRVSLVSAVSGELSRYEVFSAVYDMALDTLAREGDDRVPMGLTGAEEISTLAATL
jgi:hypothetical protein